jgi:adenylate cyclase
VLRFIGDAMLIVFPVDEMVSPNQACEAALDAAQDAFGELAILNVQRKQTGQPSIRFGVGLHLGEVIYGNVGAPDRLDFTVMGPAVNRTARLESLTKDLGSFLLMSSDFAEIVGKETRSLGHHSMKGVAEKQEVFALLPET